MLIQFKYKHCQLRWADEQTPHHTIPYRTIPYDKIRHHNIRYDSNLLLHKLYKITKTNQNKSELIEKRKNLTK